MELALFKFNFKNKLNRMNMDSQERNKKEPFIELVYANKELLFGKFNSDTITKEKKREKWIEIKDQLVEIGINLIPSGRDWTYLRDVVWRNQTDSLKRKLDRKRKTGQGRVMLSNSEKKVLGKLFIFWPVILFTSLYIVVYPIHKHV